MFWCEVGEVGGDNNLLATGLPRRSFLAPRNDWGKQVALNKFDFYIVLFCVATGDCQGFFRNINRDDISRFPDNPD